MALEYILISRLLVSALVSFMDAATVKSQALKL